MNRIGHVHQIHIRRPLCCYQNAILIERERERERERVRESVEKKPFRQEFLGVYHFVS